MELEPLLSMEWEQKLLLKKCLLNWKRSYVYRKIRIIGKKSARKVRAQFVCTSCYREKIYKLFCYCTAPRSRGRWKYTSCFTTVLLQDQEEDENIYKMFYYCTAPRSRGRWRISSGAWFLSSSRQSEMRYIWYRRSSFKVPWTSIGCIYLV